MTQIAEELFNLVKEQLNNQVPIMSGNMKNHISVGNITDNSLEIVIDAQFYDINKWKKTKQIIYTGYQTKSGETSYARIVNEKGAFAKGNESKHWANRVLNDIANSLAPKYNAEVICEIDLS